MAIWNIQTIFIGVCAVCTAWIFHNLKNEYKTKDRKYSDFFRNKYYS